VNALRLELDRLLHGSHRDPHTLLGKHLNDGEVTFRTLKPNALSVEVHIGDSVFPMNLEAPGIWSLRISSGECDLSTYFLMSGTKTEVSAVSTHLHSGLLWETPICT